MNVEAIEQIVKGRYGQLAVTGGHQESCCAAREECGSGYAVDQSLYTQTELSSVPDIARNLSRGCGNPTGFANLKSGDIVADFGCGAGIDVVLAARKVVPWGKVIGIDFTSQMIERAKESIASAGLHGGNIELRTEDIKKTGLPDGCVDIVISNCVINLSADKKAVYKEAFRILRPGGRLAISDVLLTATIPAELESRFESTWAGCLGGAVVEKDYFRTVTQAGFIDIQVVGRHSFTPEELNAMAHCPGEQFTPRTSKADLAVVQGKVESIKFTALKPS